MRKSTLSSERVKKESKKFSDSVSTNDVYYYIWYEKRYGKKF